MIKYLQAIFRKKPTKQYFFEVGIIERLYNENPDITEKEVNDFISKLPSYEKYKEEYDRRAQDEEQQWIKKEGQWIRMDQR